MIAHGDEVVRGLIRGARLADLAWSASTPPEALLDAARQALVALNPSMAERLDPGERRRVTDYLLRQQSAGQAAGTWRLLEQRADARRFALFAREALAGEYVGAPPPIPGLEAFDPRAGAAEGERAREAEARGRRARRQVRGRRRQELDQARRRNPFRPAAVRHFTQDQERVQLPNYSSRRVVSALWGLLGVAVACLALILLARVPTRTSGSGFVVGGPGVVLVLPADRGEVLRRGREVRLRLPGVEDMASVEVRRAVGVLAPRTIRLRYGVERTVADRIEGPSAVALGRLDLPPDARPARSYVGAVGRVEATLGSRPLRSLLPVIGAVR